MHYRRIPVASVLGSIKSCLKLTYLQNGLKCLELVPMLQPNEGALPREGLIQHNAKAPPVYRFIVPTAAHYLWR